MGKDDTAREMSSFYTFKDVGLLAGVYMVASVLEALGLVSVVALASWAQPDAVAVLSLGVAALMLFRFVAFCVFLYRMNANLRALTDPPLQFTPWSMIWWFFVPIASMWKPFQAVRELFNYTSEETTDVMNLTTPGILAAWWSMWLFSNVVDWFAGESMAGAIVSTIVGVVQIVTNVLLVFELSRRMSAHAARCTRGTLDDTVAVFA